MSVQVMQGLIARELVERFGLPERHAARLLGLVPSSVSQYLSGKRLGATLSGFDRDEGARRLARLGARRLMAGTAGPAVVLEAAIALVERTGGRRRPVRSEEGVELPTRIRQQVPRWIRHRIVGEQSAVSECMRLAQRSRDELTRALFRQIASDSLRHAEIVASLAPYLDRGVASSVPTGITREDIERLLEREHAAERKDSADLGPRLGGVMRMLWESMESDERKHERLLHLLLNADLPASRRRRAHVADGPS